MCKAAGQRSTRNAPFTGAASRSSSLSRTAGLQADVCRARSRTCFAVFDISVAFLHSRMDEVVCVYLALADQLVRSLVLLATTTGSERDMQGEQAVGLTR